MNELYFSLPLHQRQYVTGLEQFDEYEEWHIKCAHYHILCSYNSTHWSRHVGFPLMLHDSQCNSHSSLNYKGIIPHTVIENWLLKRLVISTVYGF